MNSQGDKPQDDREAELREWEKQVNTSLVVDDRKKKLSGIAIGVVAVSLLGGVWYIKQGGGESEKPVTESDLTIAERKPVPKLKALESTTSSPASATPSDTVTSATQGEDPMKAQREQMEMQRREEERRMLEARLKSAIMAPSSTNPPPQVSAERDGGDYNEAMNSDALGDRSDEQDSRDANVRFAREASGNNVAVSKANQIDNLTYKILQGKSIEAILSPRTISDLPGMICGTIQRDVYGAQGRVSLIPWGSQVCGTYNAELRKGQDRLFVIWNTVRRPDGVQIALDSPGADQLGTAGMGGIVDTHFAEIFGMSALLSIIGAGASNIGVSGVYRYKSTA